MRTTVYTPGSVFRQPGAMVRAMVADVLAARELAWRLMVRDLSAMYRQTALGYFWAFVPPLFTAGTFIALNRGGVFQAGATALPYEVWTLVGTFLWQAFADGINSPIRQVSQAKPMLTKINFPREALIMAGAGEVFVNFAIRAVILVPLFLWFRIPVGWETLVLFPPALVALVGLGVMVGLLFTPVAMLYQDIEKGLAMMLPMLMLFSGAVVPVAEQGFGRTIALWNPVVPLLGTCRELLTGQAVTAPGATLAITACMLVLLGVGWVGYRVSMPHLISRIGS